MIIEKYIEWEVKGMSILFEKYVLTIQILYKIQIDLNCLILIIHKYYLILINSNTHCFMRKYLIIENN